MPPVMLPSTRLYERTNRAKITECIDLHADARRTDLTNEREGKKDLIPVRKGKNRDSNPSPSGT